MRLKLNAVLTATLIAAGCGGGSGGGSSTPTTTPAVEAPVVVAPVATPPAIVTSAPASAYSGRFLEAYAAINQSRLACGFGALVQNTKLDAAANAHLSYISANGRLSTHDEVAGQPGFTGTTVAARTTAAGYSGQSGEVVSVSSGNSATGTTLAVGFLSLPYHSIVMLYGWRDVGLAINGNDIVINFGLASDVPAQSSSALRTWPCDGLAEVPFGGSAETPSPFPDRPRGSSWGTPIIVVGQGSLKITSATVTGPSGKVPMAAIYADGQAIDPNGFCKGSVGCMIPELLSQKTKYDVLITGTINGGSFERRFSFTTSGVLQ